MKQRIFAVTAAGLMALAAGRAVAQPANDFFTNATLIAGFSGTVTGATVGATLEAGEPVVLNQAGFPIPNGASVWFRWTAPASGAVFFNTFGSAFDTVLSGHDGSNFVSLVQLDGNDDFGGTLQSQISWITTAGVEYRVRVAGFGTLAPDTGPFLLNWLMTGVPTNQPSVAGQIQFEFDTYIVSEGAPGYATISAIYGGGAPGAVSVDYFTFDGSAQEGLDYEGRSGTLVFQFGESNKTFTVPIFDNSVPNPTRTVNLALVNPVGATLGPVDMAELNIVDDETVPFLPTAGRFEFSAVGYLGTEWETFLSPFGPSLFSERHNVAGVLVTVNRLGGSTGRVLVDYRTVEDFLGGAMNNLDYLATNGTLVFDDGQNSTNFVVAVGSDFLADSGPKSFLVEIGNPRAAPGENPAVIIPTMGLVTNASVTVDDVIGMPFSAPLILNHFTFERANYRGDEYGRPVVDLDTGQIFNPDDGQAVIGVDILNPGARTSPVSVDLVLPLAYGFFNVAGRALGPGSDNADLVNTFAFLNTEYTDGSPDILNNPDLPNPLTPVTAIGATVAVQGPQIVRVTIPPTTTRCTVFLPITMDDVVEFNEDVVLRLDPVPGNPPVHPRGRFATMTILYDDQPAGMGDREWNPDNVFFTTTGAAVFNEAPGANNTVNALAVDRAQKTVIGGDFTAYNTIPRRSVARINFDGSIDLGFNPGTGANGPVTDLVIYKDTSTNGVAGLLDKILIVGAFSSYNNTARNGIAVLNPDGSLDNSFNPGAGVAFDGGLGVVRSAAWQVDGKIVIAGDFNRYNGIERNGVARINPDGSLDQRFDPGLGPNGTVWSVALLDTAPAFTVGAGTSGGEAEDINVVDTGAREGTITVNYDFLFIPDEMRIYYDGVLLTNTTPVSGVGTFAINYGPGLSTVVTIVMNQGSGLFGTFWEYTATIQTVGAEKKMMIGGDFTSVSGVAIQGIARLNANGSLDQNFNPGGGVNGTVRSVAIQGDNRVLVGGEFDTVDFRSRNSVARFLSDGSLDTAFDPGTGFDGPVYTVQIDPSGKGLFGGPFTSFNGTRRMGMARLFAHGALDTSFMDTAYNQFAGFPRALSSDPLKLVNRFAMQTNGDVMVGGSFTNLGCQQSVVLNDAITNVLAGRFGEVGTWTRQDKRPRFNVARIIGGRTPGPGNVQFTYPEYTRDEGAVNLVVTMSRVDGRLGTLLADVSTSNRTAVAGADFVETKTTPTWFENAYVAPYSIGYVQVQYFNVPVSSDTFREGNELFDLGLFNPVASVNLGGEFIPLGGAISRSTAPATIVDDDFDHGIIAFEKPVFTANESAPSLAFTLVRTNGSSGVASVDYFFVADTATAGQDYTNQAGRRVFIATFGEGVTSLTLPVTLRDDLGVEPDETFRIVLTNATGGAALFNNGPGPQPSGIATAVIIDNDRPSGRLNFLGATFATNESAGVAIITVERVDGSVGPLTVTATATAGTALAGVDFDPVTNVLTWVSGDTANKFFVVPLRDDAAVEPDETVNLALVNHSNSDSVGFQSTATLRILNDDAFGFLSFSQAFYDANENGTNLTVTVNRFGGLAGTVSVAFQTEDGTAAEGFDYLGTNGTLVFLPGEFSKTFQIVLLNNTVADGDRTITLRLGGFVSAGAGPVTVATVRVIDDESVNTPAGSIDTTFDPAAGASAPVYALGQQPDGKILIGGDFRTVNSVTRNRMARLFPNGLLDPSFNAGLGPNRPVRSMLLQPDGRIVIGGFFDRVHGTNRARIARLLADGSLDVFFDPGAGADNPVHAIAQAPDGRLAVGGAFTTFDSVIRPGIVMLNTNGTVDFSFNPREGAFGVVYAVAFQADGKVLIGGDFSDVGQSYRPYIARLHQDGSLDLSFDPGDGPDGAVRAITVQADGKVLIGGSFTQVSGSPRGGLARLNLDGSLDPAFLGSDTGGNGSVLDIKIQPDGDLIVVGDFTTFNGVTRRRITRLFESGRTDPTINFGAGADSFIAAALIQPDRRIVIGGGFATVQGQPRRSVARLHGGSVAGPGEIEYSQPFYLAGESAGRATIVVRRRGGTSGGASVDFATAAGTAAAGLDYTNTAGTLVFPEGEVERVFTVALVNDTVIEPDESVLLTLDNLTGGAAPGVVPYATLVIQSDDSQVAFSSPLYSVNENSIAGYAAIAVVRTGSTNGSVSVDYLTRPGTASAPEDYAHVSDTLSFAPGEASKTFHVPIVNDSLVEGGESVFLTLTNVTSESQLGLSAATLAIVDDDFAPGRLQFAAPSFTVNEYETNAVITVIRTNGSSGVVTVVYEMFNGTALDGVDYHAITDTLTFADGETVKTFNVPIVPDLLAETNETVSLNLRNAAPAGASLGSPSSAVLTIINNPLTNGAFSFSATNYTVTESNSLAQVMVTRHFAANGAVTVDVAAFNGTASNLLDFVAATNTLSWAHGDAAPKTAGFIILPDFVVEDTETFPVQLLRPTGGAIVGARGSSQVTILDDDVGPGFLGFSAAAYAVNENATNAFITVTRRSGRTGTVSIDASTVAGGTAVAGRDYVAATTNLVFADGITSRTFVVSVNNNFMVEGNRTVLLGLSNPGGGAGTAGQIVSATLTIVEDEQQAGSVDAGFAGLGANAPVNVIVLQTNDNKLYVGGGFTEFNGESYGHVVRLNQSGGVDTSFDPRTSAGGIQSSIFSNSVHALAVQLNGSLLVGGLFTNAGGAGQNYLVRLTPSGALDANFLSGLAGPNNYVDALALQADGRILVGGAFTMFNGAGLSRIARLEAGGALDVGFTPGTGGNGDIHALAVVPDGAIFAGGEFTLFNGVAASRLVRLRPNGTVDTAFNTGAGFNDTVRAIVVQPGDSKVIVAGYFTSFNGVARAGIARLNVDGSLDTSFNPGAGANEFINALAMQPDGKVLAGGAFTSFNGVERNRLVRLNPDGSVDYAFNMGTGADNFINTVALQTDRKVVIGGGFRRFDGVPRNYIARLAGGDNLGSGEFAFSAPAYGILENSTNATITVRRLIGTSNAVSVAFATQDGTAVAPTHYAPTSGVLSFGPGETVRTFDLRVFNDIATNVDRTLTLNLATPAGGATVGLPGSAAVTLLNDDCALLFTYPLFGAAENQASNVFISVERLGSTIGAVTVEFATGTNGTATPGADYFPQAGQLLFTNGQATALFQVPVIDDAAVEPLETVELLLSNPASAFPAGNVSIDGPSANLAIVDDDFASGQITLTATNIVVGEQAGAAVITVVRGGGASGAVSVNFSAGVAAQNPATPGADFILTNGQLVFGPGQTVKTFTVPILDDTLVEGPENIQITLTPADAPLGISSATLVIAGDEAQFSFSQPDYQVSETGGVFTVTVVRSPEGTGPVSVDFATVDGTALAGLDYVPTNGTLVFAPNQFTNSFTVTILNDAIGEFDEIINLVLSNPAGEAVLGGVPVASLFILDNDVSFILQSLTGFNTFETAGTATVQVVRVGRTNGIVSVVFNTSDGTATNALDYTFTSQLLVFADGEVVKNVSVEILNDTLGEGTEFFNLNLVNPSPGTSLGSPSSERMNIFDDEVTISFGSPTFVVSENATNAVIPVFRSGFSFNPVTVRFETTNGTATPGLDYVNVAGQLDLGTFSSQDIIVPILDDALVEGDETFVVRLFNASGAVLISPSSQTVIIAEDDASVAFGAAVFNVSESATNAIIPVLRLGGSAGLVTVLASTTAGTATPGVDYVPTNNVLLTFIPGVTNLALVVPILDDLLIEGTETVGLRLSSPTNAVLGTPNVATLNIINDDASIIVPAGSAITAESIAPANNIIDPGEQVTVNFALRNEGNVDTVNLVATLLNSGGVTGATGPQSYGVLRAGGSVASRPFTFTAAGTNGGRLTATLQLQDGANSLGAVSFDFTLGRNVNSFVNGTGITINDRAPASPYPATNIVAGLAGSITKVTVTLANLTHTFPDDLDILLVAPSGSMTLLMSDAGSSASFANPVSNVTLTFDDAAAISIPDSNQIATATYRPANWFGAGSADAFPAPAPGGPYTNASLSVFNGQNPNGTWRLFIVDDTIGDAGFVAGGWSLSITTTETAPPQADLSVTGVASPDPLPAGDTITNYLTVANNGPASASGVVLTMTLPAGMTFASASSSQGACAPSGNQVVCTIGSLPSLPAGSPVSIQIVGTPTVPGVYNAVAVVTGGQLDIVPGNNTFSVKAAVLPAVLNIAAANGQSVIRWRAPAAGYVLQYADSPKSTNWVNVPAAPVVISGTNTVTLDLTGTPRFFRLRAP